MLFNQSDSVGGTELCNVLRCDIFARSAILINTALVLSIRMKLTLTYLILFMFRRSPSVVSAFCVQHLNPEKERRRKKKKTTTIITALAITQAIMVMINRRLQTSETRLTSQSF